MNLRSTWRPSEFQGSMSCIVRPPFPKASSFRVWRDAHPGEEFVSLAEDCSSVPSSHWELINTCTSSSETSNRLLLPPWVLKHTVICRYRCTRVHKNKPRRQINGRCRDGPVVRGTCCSWREYEFSPGHASLAATWNFSSRWSDALFLGTTHKSKL